MSLTKTKEKQILFWILIGLVAWIAIVVTVLVFIYDNETENQSSNDIPNKVESNSMETYVLLDKETAKSYSLLDEYIAENYQRCDDFEPITTKGFGIFGESRYCQRQLKGQANYDLQITRFNAERDYLLTILRKNEDRCLEKNYYLASVGHGFGISVWLYYEDGISEPKFYSTEYTEKLNQRTKEEHQLLREAGLEVDLINVCK